MRSGDSHGREPASAWVQRWSHLVAPGGRVLDLACGHGRHVRWFADRGHPVVALDRNPDALASLTGLARVDTVLADVENDPWPLLDAGAPRQFDAIVVTNYLWRPLFPVILRSLANAGVLIYETFADGNASVGKPSRPDFLLRTGELLRICAHLRIVAFEDGFAGQPDRFIQRIAALRGPAATGSPDEAGSAPNRYRL
jgi:SAM-dependent methyltransferase